LFREFSIVMAGAVAISAFLALSLTPMVSSKLLRQEKHSWFFRKTEKFFDNLNEGLQAFFLNHFLQKGCFAVSIVAGAFVLIFVLWKSIPAEMAPLEDRSQVTINQTGTEGSTYEYMLAYADDVAQLVEETVPERIRYTT
jgi:multidrug efflux pump